MPLYIGNSKVGNLYVGSAAADVNNITLDAPSISVNTSNGVITSTINNSTPGYLQATTKTATLSLTTKAATTITPTSSSQTAVAKNVYTTGVITIAAVPTETKSITANGTYTPTSGKFFSSVTVSVSSGTTINNQNKTVTPTTASQSITADSGYTGLGTVTVNAIQTETKSATPTTASQDITPSSGKYLTKVTVAAIPSTYIVPSGTTTITANGTYNVKNYASATVSVSGGAVSNQNKTVTPSESSQSITADSGYTGLGTVTVNAITATYVGSGITRRSSSDLTASGATVSVPAGYYASAASKAVSSMTLPTATASSGTGTAKLTIGRSTSDQYINIPTGYNATASYYKISAVANGTVVPQSSISGTGASVSTGTNTVTFTKTISNTPNVSTAGYISAGTAGNSSISLTASITTKGSTTYTPSTSNQTIASGTYLTGTQTIAGDANLVATNIISGKSIFGVSGSVVINKFYTGSSAPASSLGNNGDIYLQA